MIDNCRILNIEVSRYTKWVTSPLLIAIYQTHLQVKSCSRAGRTGFELSPLSIVSWRTAWHALVDRARWVTARACTLESESNCPGTVGGWMLRNTKKSWTLCGMQHYSWLFRTLYAARRWSVVCTTCVASITSWCLVDESTRDRCECTQYISGHKFQGQFLVQRLRDIIGCVGGEGGLPSFAFY